MLRMRVYLPVIKYGDFHVHTDYTDGKNTIREYCQKALDNDLKVIAFTEHVRKNLDYNFNDFLLDIEKTRREFPQLAVLSGCEAKVLNTDGELDAPKDALEQCDIVIGVFHSFKYKDKRNYLLALEAMLKNPNITIWGHPTLFPNEHHLELEKVEIKAMIDICIEGNIFIERNLRYNLPDASFMELAAKRGAKFVIGSDAHSIGELPTIHRLEEEWEWINRMY